MNHIICFSGGHSSGLVAIEVVRRFGKENVILLNHNLNPITELPDIKRFKSQLSEYLGIEITYANIDNIQNDYELPDQFDVSIKSKSFINANRNMLCTSRLKTKPFEDWIDNNTYENHNLFFDRYLKSETVIYYGFDATEDERVMRRYEKIKSMGLKSDYPLKFWKNRTIFSTSELGIKPPIVYDFFKHANCIGCLKAGLQHWYVVFCLYPKIFEKAKSTEKIIGFSIKMVSTKGIKKPIFLEQLEPIFKKMRSDHIPATEHYPHFKKVFAKYKIVENYEPIPCDCGSY
ncbi:hypothetical protein [Arcicella rosea]|uniref:Phosphoadenosine phosphosulfate reductase family protein n=1 Tax=Arcicella rosea TaxID=502909 RepID=A0A841EK10_9BACT|nr:hypothetical protein [Arcicella rosea]MBB6003882.1 hypothetical protein [Arcicella rosea]